MAGRKENLADDDGKPSKPVPHIIKRVKKHAHGHHGGNWKIAFADFVTAMMAFFLLMWLLASLNKAQKEGLSDYFKQPVKVALIGGNSMGNRNQDIFGGGRDLKEKDGVVAANSAPPHKQEGAGPNSEPGRPEKEIKKFNTLKANILDSLNEDPSLSGLEDQLLMDVVSDGLRIQLIDKQESAMFELGSDEMEPELEKILHKISKLVSKMPNKISIQGHTDAHPFHDPEHLEQTNWELSTQRANAARRALISAGMNEKQVLRISGYGATIPFNKTDPFSAQNRRISIIVMKKDSAAALLKNQGDTSAEGIGEAVKTEAKSIDIPKKQ